MNFHGKIKIFVLVSIVLIIISVRISAVHATSFSDSVISYTLGDPSDDPCATYASIPQGVVGEPDFSYNLHKSNPPDPSDPYCQAYVNLGYGGELIVSMDSWIEDGEGYDLIIREIGKSERVYIYVSNDLEKWIYLGTGEITNQTDNYTEFSYDFSNKVSGPIKYVKFVDTRESVNYSYHGADIDAVIGVHPVLSIDSFTADPTYGVIPLTVTFTCEAHDPDGTISEYQWDFDGDGVVDATTTNGRVSHTYDTVGSYDATCTAVDDAGASASSSPVTILAGDHYRELNNFEVYWYHPDENYDVVVNIILHIVANLNQESRDIGLVINDLNILFLDDQQYFLPWTTIPFDIIGNNSDLDPGLGGQYGYFSDPREAYVLSDEVVLNGDVIERTITRLFGSTWATTNQPPTIDSFAVEPISGTVPLNVAVICQAEDSDGSVTTYEFNPGDGSNPLTGTDGTFSYTYETSGSYQATCTAYDDQGARMTSESVTVTVEEAAPSWNDITEMIQAQKSRTLFDRINRCFFVHLDLTNIYNEDINGPVRMVLLNNTLPLKEGGPGLDSGGYTDDGHPYFLIVPEGGTWSAGQTLEDLRLDFALQRTRLNFDLRFEALK